MNFPALLAQASSNAYFSRSDADGYAAANSAGWTIYSALLREMRGFFLKLDTTSIVLTPGTQTYQMPADFSSLICFSERLVTTDKWHQMSPIGFQDALTNSQSQVGWDYWPNDNGYYDYDSPFSFDGPYLPAPTTTTPNTSQIYAVDIAPAIDQTRMTEIAYIAKWIPLTDQGSVVVLPDEAYPAWLALTSAELLDMNDDSLADKYRLKWELPDGRPGVFKSQLMSWARNRQSTQTPQAKMYGGG